MAPVNRSYYLCLPFFGTKFPNLYLPLGPSRTCNYIIYKLRIRNSEFHDIRRLIVTMLIPFLLFLPLLATARVLPEDIFAFPKYRVTYLNALPLFKDTADRWLRHGLRGGEPEFLDQPWQDPFTESSPSPKGIESSNDLLVDHVCSPSYIADSN